jgi:hypothetical protein
MKLHELAAPQPTKQIAKVFESYFGSTIQFEKLNRRQTQHLLTRVRSLLGEHRSGPARHQSEKNPSYLKLVMMEQALVAQQQTTAPTGAAPAAPTGTAPAGATNATQQVKDPKLAAALKKSQAGQTLSPDEQKLVAGAALMKAESRMRKFTKLVFESEVQQAQVVLAAQDMVDKMQGMLEDVSELQFKELPALVDSIKNQVGIDQAQQFNTDATAALTGLMQNLQGAKQQLDAALGVVTGQAPAAGAADMAAGAGMDAAGAADMGAGAVDDLAGAEMPPEAGMDDLAAEPAAAALGRAKR